MAETPQAGWYHDPSGPPGQQRWWNGASWGEQTRHGPASQAPVVRVRKSHGPVFWIVLGLIGVIVIAALNAGGGSDSSSPSSALQPPVVRSLPASAPPGAIAGELSRDCDFKCTSPDAARALSVGTVYCYWDGHDVKLHAFLRNPMNARVTVSITPKYYIQNGGQHGTSFASDVPIVLKAHQARGFVGNAGHPEGVADGTQISKCAPHLHDIDIG